MGLRDQAKQGLGKMEAMGQMGNSEEATLPDNTPFMANTGGVAGVNVQDPAQLPQQPSVFQTTNPQGQVPNQQAIPPIQQPIGMRPPAVPTQQPPPRTFENMLGGVGFGQLQQQVSKLYKNNETGETRVIPFVGGKPIYPIPAGFVPIEEAGVGTPDTGIDTAKVETTRVTDDDDDKDTQTASGATGSFSLGDIDLLGLGLGAINPLLGIGYQALKRQKSATDFKRGPSFSDRATGKFSGSPASGYFDRPKTNKIGTGVGDTDVNTQGTFNNSFAVDDNQSDLHTYGGAKRNEQGHTIYRTINEQVKSLKSAAKTGWFGGPLSAMEYQGLTEEGKKRYNNFAQEFKKLGGDIDGQIYGTVDENGNLVNSDNYVEYLNTIRKENVGGAGLVPDFGDGYLVSNGKAYKGKFVKNENGDTYFEKIGGGTIISTTGRVGDLTGLDINTTEAINRKNADTVSIDEAERVQEEERKAENRAKAAAMEAKRKEKSEARERAAEANRKRLADEAAQKRREQDAAQRREQDKRDAEEREQRQRERDAAQREREKDTRQQREEKSKSKREGGQGYVRAKGGLMTKPTKKVMKRGGLASR